MPLEYRMVRTEETISGITRLMQERFCGNPTRPLVEDYIREHPRNPEGYAFLALLLQTNPQQVVALLEKAKQQCGEQSVFYHAAAMAFQNYNDYSTAISLLKKAVDLDPITYESILSLATLLNRTGKHQEAMGYWLKLVELDPTTYFGWFGLSKCEYRLGDYDRALKHITAALFSLPKTGCAIDFKTPIEVFRASYLASRAGIYVDLGRLDEALKDFEDAFSLNRAGVIGYIKGVISDLIRKTERGSDTEKIRMAVKLVEKLLDLDPKAGGESFKFYKLLGALYHSTGQDDKIDSLFDRAAKVGLPASMMLECKAIVLVESGFYDQAIATYRELKRLTGNKDYATNIQALERLRRDPEARGGVITIRAPSDNPESLPVRRSEKVGRNDPCPCGSGLKYKKCCERA